MNFIIILFRIVLITLLSTPIFAEKNIDEESKEDSFEVFLEDLIYFPGLIDSYRNDKNGKVYLLIREDQLEIEFIYFAHILDGIVQAGTWRGSYLDNGIIKFNKYFDQIRIERINTAYVFDVDSPLSKSNSANISNSLIDSIKIEKSSELDDKFLIDVTSLLLSENLSKIITAPLKESSKDDFKIGSISKNKSSINNIKNYPENTDFEISYVFSNSSNKPLENQDSRNNSISVRYSFIAYPENNFETRIENQNIGFFSERKTNLSSTDITPYEDLINKWHLEKKDKNKQKSIPIKPITFWIENTTPHNLRPMIKKAVLAWNIAFEEAGFLNAIEVKIQPDNAEWTAGDIRFNTIRWTSSPNPPFGGYGPSFTNPRTGEILGADIMLEWIYLTNRIRYSEIFENQNSTNNEFCQYSSLKQQDRLFGKVASETLDFSEDNINRLYEEDLFQLILHEVGHTLGLNHNFAASYLHNNSDIHNPEITYQEGLSSSVMDYHGLNIAPLGTKQGQYADIKPGKYDLLAIKYAYTPDLSREDLDKMLEDNSSVEFLFGNDGDDMRSPGKGIDPRINTGDMSNNPIEYAKDRIILSQHLIPKLYETLKTKSNSWESIYQGYRILLRQIHTSAEIISRQVGGVYISRGLMKEDSKNPYNVVPYNLQKKSIKILSDYYFDSSKLIVPAEIANKMQRERRSFDFFGKTEDPKIHSMILKGQKRVLKHFTNSRVLKRLTDSSFYGNKYLPSELLNDLTASIFNQNKSRLLNGIDQNLQSYFVKRLIMILKSGSFDSPSISASFFSLERIMAYTFSPSEDKATENHKKFIRYQVKKILESN
tara:strand:+ start:12240 stop:14720 length:2481 start_codon:yes stop_codon:yes gene_type:complete